jgi:hypothetical protein
MKTTHRIAAIVLTLLALGAGWYVFGPGGQLGSSQIYRFEGVRGPLDSTVIPPEQPTPLAPFAQGGQRRLAVLLTDPDSAWLGLAHGLKTIGVPFIITRDYREALQHRAVLVYPTISGAVLDATALKALSQFAREGGTLVAGQVLGGGFNEVFGFEEAIVGKHSEVRLDTTQALNTEFTDPKESTIRIGNPVQAATTVGSYSYSQPRNPPLAVFEDGSAAITQKAYAKGHAYALGMDLGFLLNKGYNNREEGIARSYVNDFEPSLDVLLRLLKNIYLEADPEAVTLATVPAGQSLAVVISHDIDYTRSLVNSVQYAEFEKREGIPATHFIQVKYIKDWNDAIFFNADGVKRLQQLQALGVEIGSHSISHSLTMNKFALGSGSEQYPDYQPFVKDKFVTEHASVLGELRVSKFMLEKFAPGHTVVSFRPGHLQNPYSLPQALQATGYHYSSSVTANNSLSHLPFQLTYSRESRGEVDVFEFPVTVEDEALPKLGDRLAAAIELAKKISRYGGSFIALIHTDILDHKLAFEQGFVAAVRSYAWFGSLRELGDWWAARNQIDCDLDPQGRSVSLNVPRSIKGLTLNLPANVQIDSAEPADLQVHQSGNKLVIDTAQGRIKLLFKPKA